jgi:hypothetical protein
MWSIQLLCACGAAQAGAVEAAETATSAGCNEAEAAVVNACERAASQLLGGGRTVPCAAGGPEAPGDAGQQSAVQRAVRESVPRMK